MLDPTAPLKTRSIAPSAEHPVLAVRLFGIPSLTIGDRPVRLPTRKALTFLVYVVLSPGAMSRERLAALLWPDDPPARGLANVRRHAHYVERACHEAGCSAKVLKRTRTSIALVEATVDVLEFERLAADGALEAAASLYRGDLLEGWEGETIELRRSSLRERFRLVLRKLIERADHRADVDGAVSWCRRALEHDPFDEPVQRRLMRLLSDAGERTAALEAYRDFAARLARELDTAPTPQTAELYLRLREGDRARVHGPDPSHTGAELVGRKDELRALERAFDDTPVVTIAGPPGIGKTRLAQAYAGERSLEGDGVVWIDLRLAVDDGATGAVVANALESAPPAARMAVLDNCEHALAGARRAVAALLEHDLRVLATSRERLHLDGESVLRLGPLGLPQSATIDVGEIAASEAVRLFVNRAQVDDPSFAITRANAPHLVAIARQTAGIPLALQLTAARVRALGPRMLARGFGAAPLHDAVGWSERLLEPQERLVLHRCAVFVHGWTLHGALAVCEDALADADIVAALESLVEKSLLDVRREDESVRYAQLEPIRAYALNALDESGERPIAEQAHLRWMLQFARAHDRRWGTIPATEWMRVMQAEAAEIDAALERGLRLADPLPAIELVTLMRTFWYVGAKQRGLEWTARAKTLLPAGAPAELTARLELNLASLLGAMRRYGDALPHAEAAVARFNGTTDQHGRALALRELGGMRAFLGDTEGAQTALQGALEDFRATGDVARYGACLSALGCSAVNAQQYAEARTLFMDALRIARESDDQRTAGATLMNLAEVEHQLGEPAAAARWIEQAIPVIDASGDTVVLGCALYNRAFFATELGRYGEARDALAAAIPLFRSADGRPSLIRALRQLAAVTLESGHPVRAAHIAGYAERAARIGKTAAEDADGETLLAKLRACFTPDELARLLEEGATLDEASALRLGGIDNS